MREFTTRLGERLRAVATETNQEMLQIGLGMLAHYSLRWIEVAEATGRSPTLAEFGTARFKNHASVLREDPEDAWAIYCEAMEQELHANEAIPAGGDGSVEAAREATAVLDGSETDAFVEVPITVVGRDHPDMAEILALEAAEGGATAAADDGSIRTTTGRSTASSTRRGLASGIRRLFGG